MEDTDYLIELYQQGRDGSKTAFIVNIIHIVTIQGNNLYTTSGGVYSLDHESISRIHQAFLNRRQRQ